MSNFKSEINLQNVYIEMIDNVLHIGLSKGNSFK